MPLLAACGDDNSDSGGNPIQWQPGLPAAQTATDPAAPTAESTTDTGAGQQPVETAAATEAATTAPTEAALATEPPDPGVTGRTLTAEELEQYQPNELGRVLVLEYHQLTNKESQVAQFTRTFDSLRTDLQWLYDNNFYVVSMKSVIENAITAPAGKRPVVLTFDDSPVNQFRYLFADDGSYSIDPDSGVGILEAFYAAHPDFGRGGLFGTLPQNCFFTGLDAAEEDQIDYCSQKINFLLDNGYEIGNHTLTHTGIEDVDDETFKEEIGGAIDALQGFDSRVEANIFVVPFGIYPNRDLHPEQREWMQSGFEWNGTNYLLIGSLMVGSEPAFSPVSTDWDSMWIARIQMCDCTAQGGMGWDDYWQQIVTDSPGILYVSDGNPDTITIPENLNSALDGTFDESKAADKEIIRY